jgi:ABC-type polysaccharide/polyol phosphate export permease
MDFKKINRRHVLGYAFLVLEILVLIAILIVLYLKG